jgi:glycosyltransferase involved in cell wall biosynthesis
MKTILILIKGLGMGGAEQIVVSTIRRGDRSRFRYEVAYLLPWKDALVGEIHALDAPTFCLGTGHGVGWLWRLRTLVRDRRIDVVHVHSPYAAIGARLVLPRRYPLVYTEHNVWERYTRPTRWGNALSYHRNDHVFAVSEHVRASVRYPAPVGFLSRPPIETLYHGPDLKPHRLADVASLRHELGVGEGQPLIGTIANLKRHKGLEHLLRAAVQVRRRLPDARFVVIGQGPMEPELRALASSLRLNGTVMFAGYRPDAARLVGAFDLFVLPSIHEGLAIALIEAMSAGVPAVVTRVGGLPEVMQDGREGILVPPGDPEALARAITALISDRTLRSSMGEAAKARAHMFDMTEAVRRMERVYERLTS